MTRFFRVASAALFVVAALPAMAANLRIDQEPAASALTATDVFLCEQNVGTTNNTKKCTPAQITTYFIGGISNGQIPYNNAGSLGGLTIGSTLSNSGGVLDVASTITAGTTQTVTSTQWAAGTTFVVTLGSQTLTLPSSGSLGTYGPNGSITVQTAQQSVTIALANGADKINGGTAGASVTIAAGLTAFITTDAAGNYNVTPTTAGGGTGANPTATASDTAVNGSATTFMRSDAAPAVQKGSSTQFGIVKVDGSTITATGGVISAVGGGGGVTFTDGTHTVSGATQLTVTGGTVGGTSPNATLTVSGGGSSYTCPTGFTMSTTTGRCVWTQTATSGTTAFLQFTGLTGNAYSLDCDGILAAGATSTFGVQVGESTGPTWKTTGYTNAFYYNSATVITPQGGTAQSAVAQIANIANSGTAGAAFHAQFVNLTNTTLNKNIRWEAALTASATYYHENGAGYMASDTGAITAIRFGDASGTTTFGGSCTLTAEF